MKHNLIKQLQQMTASFIFFFVIIAGIFLVAAGSNGLISAVTFWGCLGILAVIAYFDAGWISKHFVGGNWV